MKLHNKTLYDVHISDQLYIDPTGHVRIMAKDTTVRLYTMEPFHWGPMEAFFPALSPFQRSSDSNGMIGSLITPRLLRLQTKLFGVPTIV